MLVQMLKKPSFSWKVFCNVIAAIAYPASNAFKTQPIEVKQTEET